MTVFDDLYSYPAINLFLDSALSVNYLACCESDILSHNSGSSLSLNRPDQGGCLWSDSFTHEYIISLRWRPPCQRLCVRLLTDTGD